MASPLMINGGGGGIDSLQHTVVVEMEQAPPHPPSPSARSPLEVELVLEPEPASTVAEALSNEIAPLLPQTERRNVKMNIFSVSYPRRKPRDAVTRLTEAEISVVPQLAAWTWGGSRYSGVLCMALSSTVYYIMGAISDTFSAQPIPLLQTAFTRCTIISLLSFFCLRRSGLPIFGPANARKLLFARTIVGYLSMMSFIYSVQRLPLSQSIVLSFSAPILASIMARVILHEKSRIAEIGGLACSFFGVLFIFWPIIATGDNLIKAGDTEPYFMESNNVYAILMGLLSSVTGGAGYCLIRAGAKASDQPIYTVFLFGLLASPVAAVSTFFFEEFVCPSIYSFVLMVLLGVLAFFAEVLSARGLHLEKASKILNVQYTEVALTQLWGIAASTIPSSFGRLSGCLLILVSVGCTMCFGPEKETE